LSKSQKVPPYVICHDKSLRELAEERPGSPGKLHGITGLGDAKIKRYGAALLETIRDFEDRERGGSDAQSMSTNTLAAEAPHIPSNANIMSLALGGADASQVADNLKCDIGAVYDCLATAIERGEVDAASALALDDAAIDAIHGAFDTCETLENQNIDKVAQQLGGTYHPGLLKCVLAELA
jgi:ATP-dependent DNA helicase RecQ